MRAVQSVGAIALGVLALWVVTQGYTKNLQAAWNGLIGSGSAPNGQVSLAPSLAGTSVLSGVPYGAPSIVPPSALAYGGIAAMPPLVAA